MIVTYLTNLLLFEANIFLLILTLFVLDVIFLRNNKFLALGTRLEDFESLTAS